MSAENLRFSDYPDHVIAAIDRIERYTSMIDFETFAESDMTQDAVIRNLEIIGEACRDIAREDPGFADGIPAFRSEPPSGCATRFPKAISASTSISSGKPSGAICPNCATAQPVSYPLRLITSAAFGQGDAPSAMQTDLTRVESVRACLPPAGALPRLPRQPPTD